MMLQTGENFIKTQKQGSNLILIGLCGSGKSTIGVQLARRLGLGFIDLDTWIEKAENKSISKIIAEQGEESFRDCETAALLALETIKSHVIAIGGGALQREGNGKLVSALGLSLWLAIPIPIIVRRLLKDEAALKKRPLLADLVNVEDRATRNSLLSERLQGLLAVRQERYAEADLCFTDGFATPDEAAFCIKKLLHSKAMKKRPKDWEKKDWEKKDGSQADSLP